VDVSGQARLRILLLLLLLPRPLLLLLLGAEKGGVEAPDALLHICHAPAGAPYAGDVPIQLLRVSPVSG
jgi:hypothetical protein